MSERPDQLPQRPEVPRYKWTPNGMKETDDQFQSLSNIMHDWPDGPYVTEFDRDAARGKLEQRIRELEAERDEVRRLYIEGGAEIDRMHAREQAALTALKDAEDAIDILRGQNPVAATPAAEERCVYPGRLVAGDAGLCEVTFIVPVTMFMRGHVITGSDCTIEIAADEHKEGDADVMTAARTATAPGEIDCDEDDLPGEAFLSQAGPDSEGGDVSEPERIWILPKSDDPGSLLQLYVTNPTPGALCYVSEAAIEQARANAYREVAGMFYRDAIADMRYSLQVRKDGGEYRGDEYHRRASHNLRSARRIRALGQSPQGGEGT